jgi:hypothetical protein
VTVPNGAHSRRKGCGWQAFADSWHKLAAEHFMRPGANVLRGAGVG